MTKKIRIDNSIEEVSGVKTYILRSSLPPEEIEARLNGTHEEPGSLPFKIGSLQSAVQSLISTVSNVVTYGGRESEVENKLFNCLDHLKFWNDNTFIIDLPDKRRKFFTAESGQTVEPVGKTPLEKAVWELVESVARMVNNPKITKATILGLMRYHIHLIHARDGENRYNISLPKEKPPSSYQAWVAPKGRKDHEKK